MATSTIKNSYYGNNLEHINQGLFSAEYSDILTLDGVNLDNVSAYGNAYLVTNATNYPSEGSPNGRLYVIQTKKNDYNNVFQVYFPNYGKVFVRRKLWSSSQSAFVWGSWNSLW